MPERYIVGMTGGSGAILGVRLLQALKAAGKETHLVVSHDGRAVLKHETGMELDDVRRLADRWYGQDDLFAAVASGSFRTAGMVVAPCSMKTLAGVAHGYADTLLLRAADVCLKERRRVVLLTREMPLGLVHVENMRAVTLAGAIVLPPVLTFYTGGTTVEDLVEQVVGKAMDALGIEDYEYPRWK